MQNQKLQEVYKVILIGDCRVGKTSYLNSVIGRNSYINTKGDMPPTIGVQYAPTTIKLNNYNKNIQANIWDTSGAEKYKSITSSYYRKCQGAILMFDLTDRKTFLHLRDWIEQVNKRTGNKLQKIVIGNKVDLIQQGGSKKQVTQAQVTDFCVQNSITYRFTSAINGTNVIQSFTQLLQKIYQSGSSNQQTFRNNSISDFNMVNNSNSVVLNQDQTSPYIQEPNGCAKCC